MVREEHMKDRNTGKKVRTKRAKLIMRIVGGIVAAAGIALSVVGIINFVNFDNGLRFLLFAGLPMTMVGIFVFIFSFQREMTRYVVGEGMAELAQAQAQATAAAQSIINGTVCECGEVNEADSVFCKKCGRRLHAVCPKCGATVDADSAFCNKCGAPLGSADGENDGDKNL